MNNKTKISKLGIASVMALAFTLVASVSFARVDLVAIEGTWTPVGGGSAITMWGYQLDTGQACDSAPTWTPGPELTAADLQGNGQLRIRLRNCLTVPTSIFIPGQKAVVRGDVNQHQQPYRNNDGRLSGFTKQTNPNGGVSVYWWDGVSANEGTFLYMSGTHVALQVQMGLYGALKVGDYAGTAADVTLLYSEIDPALHDPTPTAATPLNYKPSYYLVNGVEEATVAAAGIATQTTVLSFLNAGLDFHIPAINNGGYMALQAEDGNPYPYAKTQYSVDLAAGKTIDALWQPAAAGTYVIFDRRGNGMNATLTVAAAP